MEDLEAILKQLHAALEHEARIDMQSRPIDISIKEGAILLGGEVQDIAQKKRAVRAVGAVKRDFDVLDRLRINPGERVGDGATRDAVADLLLRDIDFRSCRIKVRTPSGVETLREPLGEWCGEVEISVEDGVVTLKGEMISLTHKRLAGVLAWWARGTRDVINLLTVRPQEDDNDDEVTDGVRWVFETDPHVHADQIGISTRDYVVRLEGVVGSETEKRRAEEDAWFVYGVRDVVNRLEVRP